MFHRCLHLTIQNSISQVIKYLILVFSSLNSCTWIDYQAHKGLSLFSMANPSSTRHVTLAAITEAIKLVPYHLIKSLQPIRRLGTSRWNVLEPYHQMNCSDWTALIGYQDTSQSPYCQVTYIQPRLPWDIWHSTTPFQYNSTAHHQWHVNLEYFQSCWQLCSRWLYLKFSLKPQELSVKSKLSMWLPICSVTTL